MSQHIRLKSILIINFILVHLSLCAIVLNPTVSKTIFTVETLPTSPQNDITAFYKDKKGFVWIGTLDGLHRFDGNVNKTYRIQRGLNSISSNMIQSIDEDSNGNIWIGTFGKGICQINTKTDNITNYSLTELTKSKIPIDNVSTLIVDKNDKIWVGNSFGVFRLNFDKESNTISKVDFYPQMDGKENLVVKRLHEDKSGVIWVGTTRFLRRILNPNDNKLRYQDFLQQCECFCDYKNGMLVGGSAGEISVLLPNQKKQYSMFRQTFHLPASVIMLHDNDLWVGNREGVNLLNEVNGKWEIVRTFGKSKNYTDFNSNVVIDLVMLNNNDLLVGTRGSGALVIKKAGKRFKFFQKTEQKGSLTNNLVRAIFEDSKHNLWIGDEEAGISFLKNGKSYENGFVQLNVNNKYDNRAYAFAETKHKDSKSLVWVGTNYQKSLVSIDPATLKFIPQTHDIVDLGFVFAIEPENDQTLWVGTYERGLWRLKLDEKGQIITKQQFLPGNNKGLISNIIRSIYKDSKGDLWIGTDRGINRIKNAELKKVNPHFESFDSEKYKFDINRHYILQIVELDKKIWFGSMGGGLICFDPATLAFSSFTIADGMPSNTIKSIEIENGFLWIASNKGISKFDTKTNGIINYDQSDNLVDNEYSEICSARRADGTILFGSNKGVSYFSPADIKLDKTIPVLFFTALNVNNHIVKVGEEYEGRVLLNQSFENTKQVRLRYSQNNFSIGFTGLHFNNASKNKFKYKLEGFDKDWIPVSYNYRIAQYTNIPEGVYFFKVMGGNCDNVWNPEPIVLKIKIDPPFLRSGIARLLYLLFFLIIAYAGYKISMSLVIRKKQVLVSKIEKENAEKLLQYKLQFFTNISHEFKTPLTLITIPLEQLLKNDTLNEDKRNKHLRVIKKNVSVLLTLIEELLDFRRIENNKMSLKLETIDINLFVESICNAFVPLSEKQEIEFTFAKSEKPEFIQIDIQLFEKVIFNLLSNAFKFTPLKGHIVVEQELDEPQKEFKITVSDDGEGISQEVSERIFERYFQGENRNSSLQTGTGIGLSLSKEIVEIHGGVISYQQNSMGGSSFIIRIPINPQIELTTTNVVEEYQFASKLSGSLLDTNPLSEELVMNSEILPKLLIVEDNIDLREQLYLALADEYNVILAENGEQGYKLCKKEYPDIIISDVVMPKMTGIEMCDKIKTDEEISHIPILILTAKNSIESQLESYSNGADAYLSKPFDLDVLRQNLKSLLLNRELVKEKFKSSMDIDFDAITNSSADHKFLDSIWKIINDNMENSEFSIEDLATKYGVSRIYLNRKIKALTGETSNHFLRNIRLKYASELLAKTDLSVAEITWKVGYNDLNTFRIRFKEKYGVNPSDYKSHLEESQE